MMEAGDVNFIIHDLPRLAVSSLLKLRYFLFYCQGGHLNAEDTIEDQIYPPILLILIFYKIVHFHKIYVMPHVSCCVFEI